MGIVHILPHELVNQIAAGEVIERPASVVKELLENALDAGSDSIAVEITRGGIDLIRVADNGCGMEQDDLETAVLRHATSKIKEQKDLFSIHTLGFRGEALPSILSVSRADISTRPHKSSKGRAVSIEAGKVVNKTLKGMPEGTVVEIRDLFFNMPARKKFLKTTATEQRHIADIISRYAIACPSIRFLLTIDGRTVLNLRQDSTLEERVGSVWGKGLRSTWRTFFQERPGLCIHGIVATPEETRPNRSGIYTYVNNRSVRDQTLTSAIIQGYRGLLMKQRYPHAILFVEIDPLEVDVNVHPAKAEVRFKNGSAMFGLVANTIEKTFQTQHIESFPSAKDTPSHFTVQEHMPLQYKSRPLPAMDQGSISQKILFEQTKTTYADKAVIGTLHSTYILLEGHSSLYIVDQHAAHERITYEKLKSIYTQQSIQKQMLLTPVVLELTPVEYSAFDEISSYVSSMGIETAPFGESALAVRSIPVILDKGDIRAIIFDLIHEVLQENSNTKDYLHDILASIACHASIRSGDCLAASEIQALLKDLDDIGSPLTCPHGRPLFKRISSEEIERWIKRRP
ncbi:MAG TPA: DNA mismatch repair endonuclease MutL [Deltaproteobacteria bacterium]|nr:DNA mismatch repair endonuclease MutL [Deltaproteobacteria bacterium]